MLRLHLHTGDLEARCQANQVATIDLSYRKKEALADYMVHLTARGLGEVQPQFVMQYPRWSASLWDLVARGLVSVLYKAEQAPPAQKPDKRCAYATRLCAVLERDDLESSGVTLGTGVITQVPGQRGHYRSTFETDIMGKHEGTFAYGAKRLDMLDLLLRALCWSLYGKDTLGPLPGLVLPPAVSIDGKDRFHIASLPEPAKTGFARYRALSGKPDASNPLALAEDYVEFLMKG